MNTRHRPWLRYAAVAGFCFTLAAGARADDSGGWDAQDGNHIVSIGHDSTLEKGQKADDVVTIFGSSIADGDVADSVVAVFGDARVTGTVGNSTVAVLGDAYVNGKVDGNVVAVLGNVTLGPQAEVSGQVVNVFGTLHRSPAATVEGGIERILSLPFGNVHGLQDWIHRCLLYGRPLALGLDVGWAWGLALAALAFYLLLAALFSDAVARCARTLDTHPGPSILAAILAILLSPVLYLVLLVTIVGIAVIPILWVALFCAGLFGKAVALAWLGRRCIKGISAKAATHVTLDVLAGGILMLALYLVPVIGFAAFALFGLLGFGAVVYTLILATSAAKASSARPAATFATAGANADPPSQSPSQSIPAENAPLDTAMLPRAGFWIRIGALALDALLVGIVLGLLHNGLRIELLLLAVYGAAMWKLKGTTIGGIVCDLKVVRLDGRPIDWATAIVRALGCFLSLAIVGLGFVWIALDPEHQAWHDKIAGTVVVRVPRGVPLL